MNVFDAHGKISTLSIDAGIGPLISNILISCNLKIMTVSKAIHQNHFCLLAIPIRIMD